LNGNAILLVVLLLFLLNIEKYFERERRRTISIEWEKCERAASQRGLPFGEVVYSSGWFSDWLAAACERFPRTLAILSRIWMTVGRSFLVTLRFPGVGDSGPLRLGALFYSDG
jgi:hypothetical protein